MAELILYTNPMSRGRVARWMLEEIGQPYDVAMLDFGTTMKAPDYLAVNPMGKVPALRHGKAVVTECAAICAYLADAFPEAGLAPAPGSAARGPYYRWLFFGAGPVEAAISNRALGVEVPPERCAMMGYGKFADVMDTLDMAVAEANARNGWLAGERFSAADLYIGAHIGFGLAFKSIEDRPSFRAYHERMAGRPALVRANALDDAAMAVPAAG